MKDTEFKLLDPIVDIINDKFQQLVKSGEFDEIKTLLTNAIDQLPDSYSLSLNVDFTVFSGEKKKPIPLLRTGLTTAGVGEPYVHTDDSALQKYVVSGEVSIVPEDHCPSCWGEWDFKFKYTTCPECDSQLGTEVKLMLDDDTCPWCKEGKVTIDDPSCAKCKHVVDKDMVVWG